MLGRDEWRWLPWLPLMLAEGLYARLAAGRLPPAAGVRGSVGTGTTLRLVGLGDSIIAGIGVADQAEGLVGQVAATLARRYGAQVEWVAIGESGADAAVVFEGLLPAAAQCRPQAVVLSCGVNDAVAGVRPADFRRRLRDIVDGLAAGRERPAIVFAGIPPLAQFPSLRWPLSRLLGTRAQALQQAAVGLAGYRGLRVVNFPARLDAVDFSADGFHPGPEGCGRWAHWVADGMVPGLDALGLAAR